MFHSTVENEATLNFKKYIPTFIYFMGGFDITTYKIPTPQAETIPLNLAVRTGFVKEI
jgi:hypothetical protein